MRLLRIVAIMSALLMLVAGAFQVSAEAPATDAFERTWARTDKPVEDDVLVQAFQRRILPYTPTKLINTSVEGALVCVYTSGVDQDGKPAPTDATEDDCELLLGTGKGGGGAQSNPDTFFANLGEDGAAGIEYTDETNGLTVEVLVEDLTAGDDYTAVIVGFGGCDLNDDDDCDDAGKIDGEDAVCSLGETLPNPFSGFPIVDLGTAEADVEGDVSISFEDALTVDEEQDLGDVEDNVTIVTAEGYELAVEEFNLEGTQTEINEVNLLAE